MAGIVLDVFKCIESLVVGGHEIDSSIYLISLQKTIPWPGHHGMTPNLPISNEPLTYHMKYSVLDCGSLKSPVAEIMRSILKHLSLSFFFQNIISSSYNTICLSSSSFLWFLLTLPKHEVPRCPSVESAQDLPCLDRILKKAGDSFFHNYSLLVQAFTLLRCRKKKKYVYSFIYTTTDGVEVRW